ncbi:hypothetical protein DSLPV1_120 [Dishui lake phycodnavirus 1]|uniref:hypothetical protein n=1 Tax=Dishui lake phycodnavirus 1 TaxID=2079134 RepID=UPI000CD6BA48|nr:hypothetical protein C5Y57_gp120 [Dishui lake phycodnavirus 1]AUT19091.1 hypothetical protein DSLPV1_120 [Dishui lake phycodnavirus 1]
MCDFLSLSTVVSDVTGSDRDGTHGLKLSRRLQEVAVVVEVTLNSRLRHRRVAPDEARRRLALRTEVDVWWLGSERVEIAHVHHDCCLKHSNNFFW